MKKIIKVISISVLAIILFLTIIVIKDIKYKNDISKEILNFLTNDETNKYIKKSELKWLEYAKNADVNHYDITDFVEDYISIVKKCIVAKRDDKELEDFAQLEKIRDFFAEITLHSLKRNEAEYMVDNISDEDILNYENGKIDDVLAKKLEKVFEHTGEGKWILSSNEDKTIELPYNVYVKYVSNKKLNNKNVKEILDFKIKDNIKKKDIKKLGYLNCIVKYKDNNGNIKDEECAVEVESDDDMFIITRFLLGKLYHTADNRPTLTAGQHDYDKKKKEEDEEIFEKMKLRNRIQISDETIEIPQFQKYDVGAYIRVITYDDGIEVWFNSTKWTIKDGKNDVESKNYQLFYDDVNTPEEALERYLKDEEHFKADEEFLKTNNRYYNGD